MNYEVHGMVRRQSTAENQSARIEHLFHKSLDTHYGDLLDQTSIEKLLTEIRPDEIYNLAAQSHVRVSFDIPQFTVQTNSIGVVNILEAYKEEFVPKPSFIKHLHHKCSDLVLMKISFKENPH